MASGAPCLQLYIQSETGHNRKHEDLRFVHNFVTRKEAADKKAAASAY